MEPQKKRKRTIKDSLPDLATSGGNPVYCWLCGRIYASSRHHAIPKCLRPKKNLTIPLCAKCHDWIHRVPRFKKTFYEQGFLLLEGAEFKCEHCSKKNTDPVIKINSGGR